MALKTDNLIWKLVAIWKFLRSKFRNEFKLEDYPIRYFFRPVPVPAKRTRWRIFAWTAQIYNWGLTGHRDTKLEALDDLRQNFKRQAEQRTLPRPGTKLPIEFARADRAEAHSELADDFIRRVLDVRSAWISDESSLGDFHCDETNDSLNQKIREIYSVDVSDIVSGNLVDIFDRISSVKSGKFSRNEDPSE